MGLKLGLGLGLARRQANPYGPELVIDPSFDNPASWNTQAGWTVSGGAAHSTGATGTGVYQNRTQPPGTQYRVEMTVANYVSGSVEAGPYASGATARSANGTYVQTITAGAGSDFLFVIGNANFVGDVTYFSVKQIL